MTAACYRAGADDVGTQALNIVSLLAPERCFDPRALAGAAALAEAMRDLRDCGAVARGLAKAK